MDNKYAVCVLETIGNGLKLSDENDKESACIVAIKAINTVENTCNLLRERKSICQKRVNRAYEQEQKAKGLLQDEPEREDVKNDLIQCIKLQDRYNALIEFIEELENEITI